MRLALSLSLALLAFMPGCFTFGLWEWAEDQRLHYHRATAIEAVTPAPDGGFVVRVRLADGTTRNEAWDGNHARGPASAYRRACREARSGPVEPAILLLETAVRRGLARRDFAFDPALARLAGRDEVLRLAAEPVRPPELILRGREGDRMEIVHLAPPEPPEAVIDVQPNVDVVAHGGPVTYTTAVLVTPFSFVLDVVASPVQLAVVLFIISLFG